MCACVLQCLAKCREEVCQALNLQSGDVDLSMGMSGDFEQAVCTALLTEGLIA